MLIWAIQKSPYGVVVEIQVYDISGGKPPKNELVYCQQ